MFLGMVLYHVEPPPHDCRLLLRLPAAVYTSEVQHEPVCVVRLTRKAKSVPPIVGLVDQVLFVAFSFVDPLYGTLIVEFEFDLRPQLPEGDNFGKHVDSPLVYSEYYHAGIEAVLVLGAEHMNIVEIGRGEENCPGNSGVEDDGVGVEPSV